MENKILKRAHKHALLFIKRDETIRTVADKTGFSKSTVHLDLYRIKEIYPELFKKIEFKLNFNNATKHHKGGETTKTKWKKKKGNKND